MALRLNWKLQSKLVKAAEHMRFRFYASVECKRQSNPPCGPLGWLTEGAVMSEEQSLRKNWRSREAAEELVKGFERQNASGDTNHIPRCSSTNAPNGAIAMTGITSETNSTFGVTESATSTASTGEGRITCFVARNQRAI
jgi:hypothetical protein